MNQEEYRNLIEWHRGTQRMLGFLQVMVTIMFLITVVAPVMKALGMSNWLGLPEVFF